MVVTPGNAYPQDAHLHPHLLEHLDTGVLEEGGDVRLVDGAVGHGGLLRQVFEVLDLAARAQGLPAGLLTLHDAEGPSSFLILQFSLSNSLD